eukprot:c20177_g1_i1 orf=260-817(-)
MLARMMKGSDSDLWQIRPAWQWSLSRLQPDELSPKMLELVPTKSVNIQVEDCSRPHPWRYVRWKKAHERQAMNITQKKEKVKGNFYHKVLPDEDLAEVASKYDTYTEVLMEANTILNPANVATGQILWIPRTHLVHRGNTLWSLSHKYGVSIPSIQIANGIVDPNLIYAGDIIVIPEDPDNRIVW